VNELTLRLVFLNVPSDEALAVLGPPLAREFSSYYAREKEEKIKLRIKSYQDNV
jgi:hypothetical protein